MIQFLRDNARFLAAGVLLTLSSSYGQTFFISIFAGRIQADFGLSHGQWGGIYALATTCSAVVMVWAGTLTDVFRVRVLGPLALIALALACLGMVFASSVVTLVLVIFALRLFGQGMLSHIAVVAMARWYVARRGRALSIAGLGYAMGEACLPLLFVTLLTIFDWRNLWVVVACAALVMVPVIRALLKQERTPQSAAERDESAGMSNRHWTRRQALAHPLFWAVVPTVVGMSAFGTAFFFWQVHLAEVKGWSHGQLVALFPVYTGVSIGSMLVMGWALDKLGTARLVPFFQLPAMAGFLVLWATDGIGGAALCLALMGITQGGNATLMMAFWAEFFGTRHLGAIRSLATAFMVFGSAIGPGITGWVVDLGIDFPGQMPAIAVWFALASAILWVGIQRAKPTLARAL